MKMATTLSSSLPICLPASSRRGTTHPYLYCRRDHHPKGRLLQQQSSSSASPLCTSLHCSQGVLSASCKGMSLGRKGTLMMKKVKATVSSAVNRDDELSSDEEAPNGAPLMRADDDDEVIPIHQESSHGRSCKGSLDPWESSRYSWIEQNMPITAAMATQLPKDMSGVRLACCMHLDPKMSAAVFPLLERGAAVFLTTCNPDTVDDGFVAAAVARGAEAAARRGMSPDEWDESLRAALEWGPTHLCDMGAQLTVALSSHQRRSSSTTAAGGSSCSSSTIKAALEATGTGLSRLRELPGPSSSAPSYPVFNWDDAPIKSLVHNKHMVGLTAMCALYQATQLTLHGKRLLVIGGGLVGQGVAASARSFGALEVTVAELDPARALALNFDGIKVASPASGGPHWLEDALRGADVVVTATGARHVIGLHNIKALKHKAILMNVGHARDEIDVSGILSAFESSLVLEHLRRVRVGPSRDIFLLCEGSMVNLIAAAGDSLNAFDVTLAAMVSGIEYICGARHEGSRPREGLHVLPDEASQAVAETQQRLQNEALL